MVRCFCAVLAASLVWSSTSLACTPPASKVFYSGDLEVVTMEENGPLVVPFNLQNGETSQIHVVDNDGDPVAGSAEYFSLGGEWTSGEVFEEDLLMVWMPSAPLSLETLKVEYPDSLDSFAELAVQVLSDTDAGIDTAEPTQFEFEETTRLSVQCEPIPEDQPGMCPVCETRDEPVEYASATFQLTGSKYILRRVAFAKDATTPGDTPWIWDAGVRATSRVEFRVGCYVTQARDVRSAEMATSEQTCFKADGTMLEEGELPDIPDTTDPVNPSDVSAKADAEGCSTTGASDSAFVWGLMLSGMFIRRRKKA